MNIGRKLRYSFQFGNGAPIWKRCIPAIHKTEIQNGHCGTNPGGKMTQADWATKENQIQDDFVWGIGPEALYQMTRAEYKTEPDKIAIKELIRLFNEYFLPKRNTYHNRRQFFWTKQTEAGGILAEIDRNRKRMQF